MRMVCSGNSPALGPLVLCRSNAIGAVFSLSVIAQYMAYYIPITAKHLPVGKEKYASRTIPSRHIHTYIDLPCLLLTTHEDSIQSLPIAVVAISLMALLLVLFLFTWPKL